MRAISLLLLLVSATAAAPCGYGQDLYDTNVLRTIELEFAVSDWHQQLYNRKAAGLQEYYPADMTVDGVLYPNVGVRYKGNSTFWSIPSGQKKPMNIDLDVFGEDQDLYGNTKLVLNNQAFDPSIMREVVAYKVMNEFIPASRASFVKVVINGVNYGVYTNVEHVGGPLCESRFGSGDGFRYKAVPPWSWPDTIDPPPHPDDLALQDIGGSLAKAERAYQLKNRETDPDHHQGLLDAIDVLNFTASDLLVDALEPYLDTDHAIWHLALNNVLCSFDAYYSTGQNYYLYQDPIHNQVIILPWDYNMAFGIYGNTPTDLSPTAGKGDADRPLLNKLVHKDTLRQEYLSHLNLAARQGLDPAILHAEIDAMAAMIDADVQADTRLGLDYSTWLNGVQSLKNFIQNRHDFLVVHDLLDIERPAFTQAGHWPLQPTSAERVRFWANVANANDPVETVTVHLRVIGGFQSFELFDDGLHGDGAAGDGLYSAEVAPFPFASKVEYYIRAKCSNSNGVSFLPERASTAPFTFAVGPGPSDSDVLLNEYVASNQTGPVDEAGQHEDWIELHNHGSADVDLSGMWLSDDLENPLKWQIPSGYSLAAGETLLLWADNDLADGPLHTNFKLSSGGESLVLMAADGVTLLDYHTFGPQQPDVSTARLNDGEELWVTLPAPTPNASNQISCGTRAYDALDEWRNIATLSLLGTPSPGASVDLQLSGFPALQIAKVAVGANAHVEDHAASGLSSLVADVVTQFVVTIDTSGTATIPFTLPANAALIGESFYLQAAVLSAAAVASNGIEIVVCP